MKNHKSLPHNLSRKNSAWSPLFALAFLAGLLAAPAAFAATGTDTWTGQAGTANWADANWTGVNNPPLTGDTLAFGTVGSGGATLDNNIGSASFQALTFNFGAPAFTLGGNSVQLFGGLTDDASSAEIISLPIILTGASQTVDVVSGASLTISGMISGPSDGIALTGGGVLTLTGAAAGANSYTGATAVRGGTLALDFTQGGSTPTANIISSSSTLSLGGNLAVKSASGSTAQSFASTALAGSSQVSVSGTGVPTVTFGTFTVGTGASVVFNGPVTSSGSVPTATATYNTASAPAQGAATAGEDGVMESGAANNAYATVGLYDWASTDLAAGGSASGSGTVIGGSSVTGFYVVAANSANPSGTPNWDISTQQTAAFSQVSSVRITTHPAALTETLRFNSPHATYIDVKGGNSGYLQTGGLLITPSMGQYNVGICELNLANSTLQIVQNNTSAVLVIGLTSTSTSTWMAFTGASSTGAGGEADTSDVVVVSGPGALFLNPIAGAHIPFNVSTSGNAYSVGASGRVTAGTYDSLDAANTTSAAFYLNGGVTVINNANQLGNPSGTQGTSAGNMGTVNLNGGTLMGAQASFSLLSPVATGTPARPVFVGGNGGGLAAQSTFTLTVPAAIANASATGAGPLTIGIPASSANGSVVGLVPGTGTASGLSGLASPNNTNVNPAFNATGTVLLTGPNTYTGGTTVASGTLQLGASGALPNVTTANATTVNSGATLDMNTFSPTIDGLAGAGTVTSSAAGALTLSIGNANGGGSFSGVIQNGSGTVALTKAGIGTENLSGVNTYTGNTTVNG
ncbi:MAG: autotransporter-associated beta strand repeat-containing protein, partial [Verrucomicrobiota bacterium]